MKTRYAFTLIELLVVVGIISILAALAVPNFLEAQVRAKVGRVTADMRAVSLALEQYRVDNNNYPLDGNDFEVFRVERFDSRKNLSRLTTPIAYITSVPVDPFHLDNASDPGTLDIFTPGNPPYPYIYMTYGNYSYHQGKPEDYGLFSLGPDSDIDAFGITAVEYDPTNGTISNGDIIRTRKR